MGTGTTAKACPLDSKFSKIHGCEGDGRFLKAARLVLDFFARLVQIDESDIMESEELQQAAGRYLPAKKFALTARRKMFW